ncbi:MAG: cyclic nucleotide-binding/CBS domain-containing protein [Proteobacteria bacterium]|nr:MAG: cyclic nucleotide-binding/CBS domain-containing protein [Pseudomonadota bacterium]QKK11318.1 MAG: cyclic nucleotide-binding/CBS domain-containing protein [Pseudomonadota bacterium]
MEVELLEIRDFLASHHPFDQLPDAALSELPPKLEVRYFRRESPVPDTGSLWNNLSIIRTGAIELRSPDDELLAHLGEGDLFGYRVSQQEEDSRYRGIAMEDSLLYQLAPEEVDQLCNAYAQFAYFFSPVGGKRLRGAIAQAGQETDTQLNLMSTPVSELIGKRAPIAVSPETSIREAASIMSEKRISSILIVEQEHLFGIVTDRDLRTRVVAEGLDFNLPIMEIATVAPLTLSIDSFAFDALLLMARHNLHHLPVMNEHEVVGMITATDLTERHTTSAVYLAGDIYKQHTIEGLREVSAKIPQLLQNLAAADATAHSSGHIITAVGDAVTTRLLQLAEIKFGPPPVDFTWVAAGSQARNEQTAHSDQDNCMILDNSYDPEEHGEYFREFTKFVCDGLDACGYVYCPGEIMAMTDQWRQPLKGWKEYFSKWINEPNPQALMLTCVFFDLRYIYGDDQLLKDLRQFVLERTRNNTIFLAYMVGNALTHQPPLGFFRNFVLIRGGEHNNTFDLKHTGIAPIVDLARVYALAAGHNAVNTQERLTISASSGEVSEEGARDLRDALEFISSLRIQHQARRLKAGKPANNYMSPDDLSNFERNHLKDAFSIVRTMQSVLAQRYQVGRF